MKKAIHLLLISLLFTVSGIAQTQLTKDCSAQTYNDQLLGNDPQFARNQQQIESFTRNFISRGTSNMRSAGTVSIPVVVHVVYNTAVQNISDAQILSQIDALNEDFGKLNADTVNIPNAFKSLVGNMQIEFCLAKRDPSGNTTTGITRTQTNELSFTSDNKVKFGTTGGKDAWNRDQYLNIWVCYLGGNLGGYAQYPGGQASTDGVVVTYTTFGRTSNVAAPYNYGRVTTHEVGHWLNLRHIWGSSACGDDLVADTPQQDGNNFFCPTFPKMSSCSGSGSNGDMFMNHMDYTYDGCKNMFTYGQVARAQALFAPGGSREALLNSLGCIPVGSSSCSVPTNINSSAVTDNAAMISWSSTNATSYALRYRPVGSTTWITANTIAISTQLTGLSGLTTYEYQVQSICSSVSSNFSPSSTFTTLQLCPLPANLSSSSVNTTGATLNWTSSGANSYNIKYRPSGNSTWTNTTSTTNSKVLSGLLSSTTYEFQVLSVCSTVNSAFTSSQTFTTSIYCAIPTSIIVSGIQNTMASISWTGAGASAYNIRFRQSGTSSWTTYSTANPSQTLVSLIAGTSYDVEVQSVCNGTASAYSSTIVFTTTGGATSCSVPAGLNASSITSSSAILNWTSTGSASYGVRYKATATTIWSNTSSNTNSISLGGLTAGVSYEFQVYSICGTGNSAYSASSVFTTTGGTTSCAVPTGLSASSITVNSAVLSWSSSSANSYNVRYRIVGSATWITGSSSSLSLNLGSLTSASNYEFQVASVCGTTISSYSASGNFTTLTVCNTPSGLNSSSVTSSAAMISWTSTGATSYNIQYRISGSSSWTNTSSSANSFSLGGLNAGTVYEFQIASVCGSSTSTFSTSSTFTTLTNCNVPVGLNASSITESTSVLSWVSSGATSYDVRYRVSGSSTWTNTSTSSTSITIAALNSSSVYEFQVRSVCGSTTSAYSGSYTFITLVSCNIPSGLSSASITSNSAVISWNGAGATGFNIRFRQTGTSTWTNTSSSTATMTLSGLNASTVYEYQIASVCGSSTSAFSSSSSFTTLTNCNVPAGLNAASITESTSVLSWVSSGASSYDVRYRVSGTSTWTNTSTSSTSITIAALSSSSAYEFQVRSVCGSTTSAYSGSYTFVTLVSCSIPAGLSSASITSNSAVISWNGANATGFNIRFRQTGSSTWTNTSSTNASMSLTGLVSGVTYEFQISSICGTVSTAYSASANFTTLISCSVPTGLTASAISTSGATLSWTSTAANSYNVRYRISGSTTWINTSSNSTSVGLGGLSASSTYEYQIASVCGTSTSSYSGTATFNTLSVCNVPSGLTVSSITVNSASVSWTSTNATSYNVRYKLAGSTVWTNTTTATTSVALSGLVSGSSYDIQVSSVCGTTSSSYSGVSFTTLVTVTCNVPTGLTISSVTQNTANITWNSTSASSYNIRYKLSTSSVWTNTSTSSSAIQISGLISGNIYEVQIASVCSSTTSSYSASSTFTTLLTCNIPSGLLASSINNISAVTSWGTTAASSYNVKYRAVGSATWINSNSVNNSLQLTGLASSTNYEFQVSSVCGSSSSSYSASGNFTTTGAVCLVPTGYSALILNSTTAQISWDSKGAAGYRLRYQVAGTTTWTIQNVSDTFYVINGLSPSTNYEIQLRSECGSVSSSYSAVFNFATYVNCGTPNGVSAGATGSTTATVSWNSNSAPLYEVEYKLVSASSWNSISTNLNTQNLSGLGVGLTYEVRVRAVCGGVISDYSTISTFTTIANCSVPSGLGISSIAANSFNVSWNASTHSAFNIRYAVSGSNNWTLIQGLTSSPYQIQNLTGGTQYEIQVQGICSDASSNFSVSELATTTASVIQCSNDSNEPNDSSVSAKRINPNTYYYGLICDLNDQDWFEFKITNAINNVKFDLTTLAADFDLDLYDSNLILVSSSNRRGNLDEKLIANNLSKGATYYLRVKGYNGATHPTSYYTLYFSKSKSTYDPNGNLTIPDPTPDRIFTVYPNPTLGDFNIELGTELENENVYVRIMDQTGKVHMEENIVNSSAGHKLNIQRGNLTAGMYFIEVTSSKGKSVEKLIIY